MSLRAVLWGKTPKPYEKPAPLAVKVLETRESEKVIKWAFKDGQAQAENKKTNCLVALSDGNSVTKITLFEDLKERVAVGKSYLIKNYSLSGSSPPYYILIKKDTAFYRASPVSVSEELFEEGRKLLFPPSPKTSLAEAGQSRRLVTVEGVVAELTAIKAVTVGRDDVPLRTIVLKHGQESATVSLWREAAVESIEPGQTLQISHLKGHKESGHLQSTSFTSFETITEEREILKARVLGISHIVGGKQKIHLSKGGELIIDAHLWEPLDHLLDEGILNVTVQRMGDTVTKIEAEEEQEEV